ncbi:MAG: hypothetical protein OEY11_14350 [Gammaproteobacteria bacterium]|nr:hypothetical protein [Gammaproteobacteria bacterium]
MAFILGALVIVLGFYMPSPMAVGIFWSALVVAVPGLIIGGYETYKLQWFSTGVFSASMLIIAVNFNSWGDMAWMMAFLQIIPAFAAVVSFVFGWALFAPVRARKKTATER